MHYISDEIDSLPILYKFFVDDGVSVATHGYFASDTLIISLFVNYMSHQHFSRPKMHDTSTMASLTAHAA
jgi:hypothetical protein